MSSKVIVITGASSGIGATLAKQLGAQGHKLVLAARREPELRQVAAASSPDALAVVTDVTKRDDVDRLRNEAIAKFGRVDVWVNNAGRGIGRTVMQLAEQDLDDMWTTNVKSAFFGIQAIVPHFQARGDGHLINISSFLGRVPLATVRSAYSAAKAALNSLTANLRVDLARTHPDIHVTLVMPGMVATEFAANALGGTPALPPGAAPATTIQTADEVAAAIVQVIEKPVAEVYTNPTSAGLAQKYFADVGAFEAGLRGPR